MSDKTTHYRRVTKAEMSEGHWADSSTHLLSLGAEFIGNAWWMPVPGVVELSVEELEAIVDALGSTTATKVNVALYERLVLPLKEAE